MRTIAIVNQKGGCGKTTTAINLAAVLARRGLRTLLVDMDPQSHCAAGLGVPEERIDFSVSEALRAEMPERIDPARLLWPVARNLALAPSTVRLAAAEAPGGGLHTLADRDRRLERLLERMAADFDRCIIDCPPTIGLLTFNALRAARHVLVPVETSYFALRGAQRQWETIRKVVEHLGRPMRCTLLPTMHRAPDQEGAVLSGEVLASLRERFGVHVAPVVIHLHEALRQAASMGQSVVEFAPESDACADHERLADWLEAVGTEGAAGGRETAAVVEVLSRSDAQGGTGIAAGGGHHMTDGGTDTVRHLVPPAPLRPRAEGSRAAELAGRLRTLGFASALSEDAAPAGMSASDVDEDAIAAPLFGVQINRGRVRFVQPAGPGGAEETRVSVAGDFNGWSATALELRPDAAQPGVLSAEIELAPGRYQYRVVRGGRWQADPHHPQRAVNAFGEENSVLIIALDSAEPT